MNIKELKEIFEYELKRKLAQRSRSPIEELRKLISSLKFFDYSNSMVLDKNQWIRGVLHTGLCGFNLSDLSNIFDQYDPNKTGYINYLNFSRYLYGKEEFMPFKGNQMIMVKKMIIIIKILIKDNLFPRDYMKEILIMLMRMKILLKIILMIIILIIIPL